MRILWERFVNDGVASIATVAIDGQVVCFGLEDAPRAVKVPGRTRIPAGTYGIAVRTAGGFHARYAARFGALHRGMLQLADVPGFTDILVHCGNAAGDTAGCLLVGMTADLAPGRMAIGRSVEAYTTRIYNLAIDAALAGQLAIEIRDRDGGTAV